MKIKLVFLGTPLFSVPCLASLLNCEESNQHSDLTIDVLAVVTQPDKPSGRGQKLQPTAIKQYVQEHAPHIPVFQPKSIRKDAELIAQLKALEPDYFITIAFGQILSQEVLDIPKKGTINVHASLLPELRGANPIQWAILQGKTETGLTTMLTDIGVDTGDMLLKRVIPIGEEDTTLELAQNLSKAAGPLLLETLKQHATGQLVAMPQPHEQSTHAPKLSPEVALIDWTQPTAALHNKIRGQQPSPGAYTYFQGERFKLLASTLPKSNANPILEESLKPEESLKNDVPGSILAIMKEGLLVKTGDGAILLKQVQPAGKKAMAARDWANGVLKQKPWPPFTAPAVTHHH
jgi:methionyl-tRNA formyltransferase